MNAIQTASRHPVSHVVFGPDGATMAVIQPNYGITLQDRATGHVVATIPIPRVARFSSVVFCDDGRKLAVGSWRGLHIFDAATGGVIWHYRGRDFFQPLLGVDDDKLIVGNDARVQVVEFPRHPVHRDPRLLPFAYPFRTSTLALSADGRLRIGLQRTLPRPVLIELQSDLVIGGIPNHLSRVPSGLLPTFTFSQNGERLAVCDRDDLSVYNTTNTDSELDDEPASGRVQRAGGTAVAPKPRLRLQPIFTLAKPDGDPSPSPVVFTPDGGALLVRRPRNRVQLWDIATGCKTGEWSWRLEWVTCLAVAPDGLTAAAGARFGRVVLWDLE
jgi:WD40 repeat protein